VTLGLGLNRVLVLVVDLSMSDEADDQRRVLNVYTLTIYRQARITPPSSTHSRRDTAAAPPPPLPPQACRLLQVGNNKQTSRLSFLFDWRCGC